MTSGFKGVKSIPYVLALDGCQVVDNQEWTNSPDPQHYTFQIFTLRAVKVHRVVPVRTVGMKDTHGDTRLPGGTEDDLPEQGRRHVTRSGTGHEIASRPRQIHGMDVEFPVTPGSAFKRLPGFAEDRGIKNNQVKLASVP